MHIDWLFPLWLNGYLINNYKKTRFTLSSLISTVQSPCGFSPQNSTDVNGHLSRPRVESSLGLLASKCEVVPWGEVSWITRSPRRRCVSDKTNWTCSKVLMEVSSFVSCWQQEKRDHSCHEQNRWSRNKTKMHLFMGSYSIWLELRGDRKNVSIVLSCNLCSCSAGRKWKIDNKLIKKDA